MATVAEIFPKIAPYDKNEISITDKDKNVHHHIYYEQCGNPGGKPIICLSDGPGIACSENHRRLFDPKKWRIITIDPRACGRSKPHGELRNNNLDYLADDIKNVIDRLGIKQTSFASWSWGSVLAFFYSIKYPATVAGIVAGYPAFGEKGEIKRLFNGQIEKLLPREWYLFISSVPPEYRDNIPNYYHFHITTNSPFRNKYLSEKWIDFRMAMLNLENNPETKVNFENTALIETYYLSNYFFLEDCYIVKNSNKIPSIPVRTIHSQDDPNCPPTNADVIQRIFPKSVCNWTPTTIAGKGRNNRVTMSKFLTNIDMLYSQV